MKLAHSVLGAGTLLAAVVVVGGCGPSQEEFDALKAKVETLNAQYVATHDTLVGLWEMWTLRVGPAVCNLEKHTNPPNPPNPVAGSPSYPSIPAGTGIRVCPQGDGDQSVPPPPPPRH